MTREEKLDYLSNNKSIASEKIDWQQLTPDEHGDWLNKRIGGDYDTYPRIGDKKDKCGETNKVFCDNYSLGLQTSRDAWCFNYSISLLRNNMKQMTSYYNQQRELLSIGAISEPDLDSTKIKMCSSVLADIHRNKQYKYDESNAVDSIYRPYCKINLYYCENWNHRTSQMPWIFPQNIHDTDNRVICTESPGGKKDFSCLMVNSIPDLHVFSTTQCFPLYVYNIEDKTANQLKQQTLFTPPPEKR